MIAPVFLRDTRFLMATLISISIFFNQMFQVAFLTLGHYYYILINLQW